MSAKYLMSLLVHTSFIPIYDFPQGNTLLNKTIWKIISLMTSPIVVRSKEIDTHIATWMNLHNVQGMNTEDIKLDVKCIHINFTYTHSYTHRSILMCTHIHIRIKQHFIFYGKCIIMVERTGPGTRISGSSFWAVKPGWFPSSLCSLVPSSIKRNNNST